MKSVWLGFCAFALSTGFSSSATAAVIHTASYNGHTYHLLDTDGTKWWFEAEAEAVSLGGHLVTINDAAEDRWIFDTFSSVAIDYANKNNLPDRNNISLWIGLSDRWVEGVYQWSSGEPINYLNWSSGQPQGGSSDEDFGGIFVNWAAPGKWHDIVGDTRASDLPFGVVEILPETVPEPSSLLGLITVFGVGALFEQRRQKSR